MAPQDASTSHQSPVTTTERFNLLADSAYSLSRAKVNEITKLLRDCGAEMVINLPKIAVIGNQSAGKSSLIETISQIKVPRSKGTTTRCPMEVRLSKSSQEGHWHCKVSLRFEDSTGAPANAVLGTPVLFADITTPDEVSLIIRRAQLAILNPNTNVEHFQALDKEECENHSSEMAFSRNIVMVEIENAEVDVTFIDLPGIIANTNEVFIPTIRAKILSDRGRLLY